MTRRYYARLYGAHGGELDSEQILGGNANGAIRNLCDRCSFAEGDVIKIEQYEEEE